MFIEWNDAYKLGIPAVDTDHRQLIAALNRFFDHAQRGASAKQLAGLLDELMVLTQAHFEREEGLLDHANYPDLSIHAAHHMRLVEDMRHFRRDYTDGVGVRDLTVDAAEFLRNWLLRHIVQEDLVGKPYLMRLT